MRSTGRLIEAFPSPRSVETVLPITIGKRRAGLFDHGFFQLLGRASAPLYVACLERLVISADEFGQIAHEEALLLIRDTLMEYPRVVLEEDEGAAMQDLRQRAGQIFNRMIDAQWLHTRRVSLNERWVLLSPRTRPLLRALGEIVIELLDRVGRAGDQMLAVENLILDYEEKQRSSLAPGETLQRFLVDFHEGELLVCYDTLERGGLLLKFKQARVVVQEALGNPFAKQRLAEGIRWHDGGDESTAYAQAEQLLALRDRRVAGIPAKQRSVEFQPPLRPALPIPDGEPGTWGLLFLGLGLALDRSEKAFALSPGPRLFHIFLRPGAILA